MILPIIAYGDPVLKTVAQPIGPEYPNFTELLANMWQTMYHARGVGLAAPQIGLSIRLFIVDASPFAEEHPELAQFKKVFINAQIVASTGDKWAFNEGCLSIPDIREDVLRESEITIRYQDEQFNPQEAVFSGIAARIIQHEYDHIEGKLFVDYLSPLKRQLINRRLNAISRGQISVPYKMRFPNQSKKR